LFTPGLTWFQLLFRKPPNYQRFGVEAIALEEADHTTGSSLLMTDRWQQVEKLCQSTLELKESLDEARWKIYISPTDEGNGLCSLLRI
jgi:hypothetical protein